METVEAEALLPVLTEVLSADGGEFSLVPGGQSMLPFLGDGTDRVLLVAPKEIKVGDMIFYRRENGQCVLHRVIRKGGGDGYLVCGDNQYATETVSHAQIFAKVRAVIRPNGETDDLNGRAYRRYLRRLPYRRLSLRLRAHFRRTK